MSVLFDCSEFPTNNKACKHLRAMLVEGKNAHQICDVMQHYGWAPSHVTAYVHTALSTLAETQDSPLYKARMVLCGAAQIDTDARGGWRLHGRQSTALGVVMAANTVLNNFGFAPISYPGVEAGQ